MKRLIEIAAQKNGAHQNRVSFNKNTSVPNGWAVIADDLKTDHFPFGDVTVKQVNGVMTVTEWHPLPIPEVPDDSRAAVTASDILNILLGEDDYES